MSMRGPNKEFVSSVRRLLEELQHAKAPEKPKPLPGIIEARLEEIERLTKELTMVGDRTISNSGITAKDLERVLREGELKMTAGEKKLLVELGILKDQVEGLKRVVKAERKKREKKEKKGGGERKKKFDRTGARTGWKPL